MFSHMTTIKNLDECFYSTKYPDKTQPHFCHPNKDFKHFICCKTPCKCCIDKHQRYWFSEDGISSSY